MRGGLPQGSASLSQCLNFRQTQPRLCTNHLHIQSIQQLPRNLQRRQFLTFLLTLASALLFGIQNGIVCGLRGLSYEGLSYLDLL